MSYNGFISYSHAADGRLAPAVQRGLHKLAKPWYRARALWIFRDQTGLSVTPALWSTIQKALDDSSHFVLMASPDAARSKWVNREIQHWIETKSAGQILPVLTEGKWEWDTSIGDFTDDSTAVPDALRGVFAEEPLYLDLRWARDDPQLSLRHSRFRDAIAQLAAPMHGVSKDRLESEDVRQHRRASRLRMAAVLSLLGLALLATVAGMFAVGKAAEATAAAREAVAQQHAAAEQKGSAQRFAEEARRQEEFANQQEARAAAAGAEADRQEKLAQQQKGLTNQAEAEASRQLDNADRAAARARQQERLARQQTALARQSAAEARRQEQRAREQEALAREQARLADEAAADARLHEQKAKESEQKTREAAAEADRQERIAIGRRLINEAKETLHDDAQTALRLGVAAERISPETNTRREVAALVNASRKAGSFPDAKSVAPGPDGLVASLNSDGTASLWDITTRAFPRKITTMGEPDERNYRVALSPNGKVLAISGGNGAQLWDVSDRNDPKPAATMPDTRYWYGTFAFSPDGHTLATSGQAAGVNPRYATLWDITDLTRPVELSALYDPRRQLSDLFQFSGDGNTFVAGNHVWDVRTLKEPALRSLLDFGPFDIRAGMSRSVPPVVATTRRGGWDMYNLADPAKPKRIAHLAGGIGPVEDIALNSDGSQMASVDRDDTVILWDIGMHTLREASRVTAANQVRSLGFNSDDQTLITTDRTGTAVMWSVTEMAPARPGKRVTAAHTNSIMDVVYRKDGRSVITLGYKEPAVIWDATDPAEPVRRAEVRLPGDLPEISPDGTTVATYSGKAVTLTDVTDASKPSALATFMLRSGVFRTATFSADGRVLAVLTENDDKAKQLEIWDLTDRRNPAWKAEIPRAGFGVRLSPDGRTVGFLASANVDLWDLTDPVTPRPMPSLNSRGRATEIAFGPDGNTVVVANAEGTTTLWDVTQRTQPRPVATLKTPGGASVVVFSKDGKMLATASTVSRGFTRDSTATVWDVTQLGRPSKLASFKLTIDAEPVEMTFGPDDRTLAVGYDMSIDNWDDGDPTPRPEFQIWDLTEVNKLRADPSKVGCAVAGGGLTAQEWAGHIPELPYRRTCG